MSSSIYFLFVKTLLFGQHFRNYHIKINSNRHSLSFSSRVFIRSLSSQQIIDITGTHRSYQPPTNHSPDKQHRHRIKTDHFGSHQMFSLFHHIVSDSYHSPSRITFSLAISYCSYRHHK